MRPNPFTTDNPNDPEDKWLSIKDWFDALTKVVTGGDDDESILPFGRTESAAIRAACDKWLRDVLNKKRFSPDKRPPARLRPWLWARLIVIGEYVDDKIEAQTVPPKQAKLQDALSELLIKQWDRLHQWWAEFSFDGEHTIYRSRRALSRDGRYGDEPGESAGTDLNWARLYDMMEMLMAAFSQRVNHKLPFGQMPTPEIERRCDELFDRFFNSGEEPQLVAESAPIDLVPWLAARCVVAAGQAFGRLHYNAGPPPEESVWDAMEKMVTVQWHAGWKNMWPGVYDAGGGQFRFRGDPIVEALQRKGQFFGTS